jgi:hypothetical protein
MIVTAYRVSQEYLASLGPKTSAMQQFCNLLKQFRDQNMEYDTKLRFQFIVDLQAWLQDKISQCIDANNGLSGKPGQFHPIEYMLDTPIIAKGHDGTLAILIRSCGLCNPLHHQHPGEPPPPTYNSGKDRIDYILTTPKVLDSTIRSGLFPYDSIFLGDHRACFLDIDSKSLFQEMTSIMAPTKY